MTRTLTSWARHKCARHSNRKTQAGLRNVTISFSTSPPFTMDSFLGQDSSQGPESDDPKEHQRRHVLLSRLYHLLQLRSCWDCIDRCELLQRLYKCLCH